MEPNDQSQLVAALIFKYLQEDLSEKESQQLEDWKNASITNTELFQALITNVSLDQGVRSAYETRESKERVKQRLAFMLTEKEQEEEAVPVIPMQRRRWIWAAASVVLLIAGVLGWMQYNNGTGASQVAQEKPASAPDIDPGSNKAVLTLATGERIVLDDAKEGDLALEGNTRVIKLDSGQLAYQPAGPAEQVSFNTLTTPRGGQFRIVLPDGTKVWLNAASSLTYPTAFTGNDREVRISGEAYLEVAKNPSMPFKVRINDTTSVEVLGTHFNVMAYDNEAMLETTLLEGAVKFKNGNRTVQLRPGQQSQLQKGAGVRVLDNINTEQVIAWKNGLQSFSNADIKTIMRQVERWYDITVEYQGTVSKRQFTGELPRDAKLSELLKLFEVNKIRFSIDAAHKKLLVLP